MQTNAAGLTGTTTMGTTLPTEAPNLSARTIVGPTPIQAMGGVLVQTLAIMRELTRTAVGASATVACPSSAPASPIDGPWD